MNETGDTARRCLWLTKGLGRGGVERLLVDMYPLVDPEAYRVDVAYVLPWKDNHHRPLEELGARVFCLGSGRADPRWIARLGALLRRERYDVVHSHAPVPGAAARLLAAAVPGSGPALVHTEHNMWDRYRLPTRWANSLTYSANAVAVAVSDTVAATIRPVALPGTTVPPVETVHHGTVLGSVQSYGEAERLDRRRSLDLPTDRFLIGKVGNFTPKKDHANLLRALATDTLAKAHLVLIGLGPLEEELRAQVDQLGLADRVTFLGSRDDVFELLPLLDVFCLSSQFEGFPIALVEAMATGLPCVATTAGGIPEVVDDGVNGLLVPTGDHEALAAAIGRMEADPALARRCGDAARDTAQGLDLRTSTRRLQELYDDILDTASP